MNKYFKVLIGLITMMFLISNSYSVMTYVGVEILNLTDDPTSTCAGKPGYGSSGRLRALSSVATYPIYFNLSKTSDGSTVWAGDDTNYVDYAIGDTLFMPNAVDLTVSEEYNFFFDVDMIRIYLNMGAYAGSSRTADDQYWTDGYYVSIVGSRLLSNVDCVYTSSDATSQKLRIYGSRDLASDNIIYIRITDWEMDSKYLNLRTSTIGNFDISFTYS